jgi:hypothetical protein
MPLFEVTGEGLVPFAQVPAGAELYERQIEDLFWSELDSFLGESLFPVARQATLPGGGRADVLALDEQGRVVVVEIKRDVDRNQLAQCLEYAGWARSTNLDELARLYHAGPEAFFADWQQFTDTATPVMVNRSPKVVLVARTFEGRTRSALDFLRENGLPVSLVTVTVYRDATGRQFIDAEIEAAPEATASGGAQAERAGRASPSRRDPACSCRNFSKRACSSQALSHERNWED